MARRPSQVLFYVSMERIAIQYVNSNTEEGKRPQTQRPCLRPKQIKLLFLRESVLRLVAGELFCKSSRLTKLSSLQGI